jgi:DNA-binding PadR family transcriptional regulator
MSTSAPSPAPPVPLTPAVFAILLALADGEKHGYAIMLEARQHITMGPGTLYGSIDRLLAAGLIAETGFTDDERRRYYRLSALGHQALSAETTRLAQSVKRARSKGVRVLTRTPNLISFTVSEPSA